MATCVHCTRNPYLLFFWCSEYQISRMGRLGEVPRSLNKGYQAAAGSRIQLRFWHYLLGDSIRFHRVRAQSCKAALLPPYKTSQAQVVTRASDQMTVNQSPQSPSLSLNNLLQRLMGLQGSILFTRLLLYYKPVCLTQEQLDGRDA